MAELPGLPGQRVSRPDIDHPAAAFSGSDLQHMQRALELAARGLWTTHPNPRVGCVLVRDGRVVGEGWHARAGEAHAEVLALRQAGAAACGATAYVTLEPCAHHGRTGPCCEALQAAGVTRVVVAAADPHPLVAGAGLRFLRDAAIQVDCGLLAAEALALNPGFHARLLRGRPWLRVKLALSLDGRSALQDGRSQWISGEPARQDVQAWRARSSAIVTGIGSILADDSRLNVRLSGFHGVQPERVVLDRTARLPGTAALLAEPGTVLQVVATEAPARPDLEGRVERLVLPGAEGAIDLEALLQALAARGHHEVLVEAGATLAGSFLRSGLCDELLLYQAPRLLGDRARPALRLPEPAALDHLPEWKLHETQILGEDLRLLLRPRRDPLQALLDELASRGYAG